MQDQERAYKFRNSVRTPIVFFITIKGCSRISCRSPFSLPQGRRLLGCGGEDGTTY